MSIRIFIIGRPGSGKSSVAQHIINVLQQHIWHVEHLFDYPLLQERFQRELDEKDPFQKRRFKPRGPEDLRGFDVINFTVLDEVLSNIANHATNISNNTAPNEKKLLLIEFARNDYQHALSLFGDSLMQDAHILYIDADLEACIQHINQRIDSRSPYGHFVSDNIMRRYYYKDDWLQDNQCQQYLASLSERGIRTYPYPIANKGTQGELFGEVNKFIKTYLLRETDAIHAVPRIIPQIETAK